MTANTDPTSQSDSTVEQNGDRIIIYHPIEDDDSAPEVINSIWSLFEKAHDESTSPTIDLQLTISELTDNDNLTHEMEVLISEFILPVGATLCDTVSINGETSDTADNGIESLEMENKKTESIHRFFPEDMTTREIVTQSTPVARYDGQLEYVLAYENEYTELKENDVTDDELLDEMRAMEAS